MTPTEPTARDLIETEGDTLFGLAYRMLGSASDAHDVVQDSFERWLRQEQSLDRPEAWLTTVVTRLCLDRLRSARRRRETYPGPWLPEPVATDGVPPDDAAAMADSLTFAFLVVLETLTPLERVVFVLHDVFAHRHEDIAAMLDRSPAAVRQTARRARLRLAGNADDMAASPRRRHQQVADAFVAACRGGDLPRLVRLLAPDVAFTSDGGGRVPAATRPVSGAERVAQLLDAYWRRACQDGLRVDVIDVNFLPGLWVHDGERTDTVLSLQLDHNQQIRHIQAIRNPDKLHAFHGTHLR